jgi:Helix-turn-helix domain
MEYFPEDLVSGTIAARKLCVDPATIRRWRREGCPFHAVGHNLIRYRLSELDAWRTARPVQVARSKTK